MCEDTKPDVKKVVTPRASNKQDLINLNVARKEARKTKSEN